MTYEKAFGQRLKKALKLAGWTYGRLAESVCYEDKTISNWCNGRSLPQLPVVAVIVKVLDVDAGWLLTGEGTAR